MSWQRPYRELNPKVEELIVTVLEEGKGTGRSPEWQTLGSVTQLDCHNPLCQRGGVDLHHTLREMVATRRAGERQDVPRHRRGRIPRRSTALSESLRLPHLACLRGRAPGVGSSLEPGSRPV